jgi:hypothetical protein
MSVEIVSMSLEMVMLSQLRAVGIETASHHF